MANGQVFGSGVAGLLSGILNGVIMRRQQKTQNRQLDIQERQQTLAEQREGRIAGAQTEQMVQQGIGEAQERIARPILGEVGRELQQAGVAPPSQEQLEEARLRSREQFKSGLRREETAEGLLLRSQLEGGRGNIDETFKRLQNIFPAFTKSDEGTFTLWKAAQRVERGLAASPEEGLTQEESLNIVRRMKADDIVGPWLPAQDRFVGQGDVAPVPWIKAEDANAALGDNLFPAGQTFPTEDLVKVLFQGGLSEEAINEVFFALTEEARRAGSATSQFIPGAGVIIPGGIGGAMLDISKFGAALQNIIPPDVRDRLRRIVQAIPVTDVEIRQALKLEEARKEPQPAVAGPKPQPKIPPK